MSLFLEILRDIYYFPIKICIRENRKKIFSIRLCCVLYDPCGKERYWMNVGEPVDVSAEKTGAENENKYISCCIGPSTVFSSST
jgi:hypothetical protein